MTYGISGPAERERELNCRARQIQISRPGSEIQSFHLEAIEPGCRLCLPLGRQIHETVQRSAKVMDSRRLRMVHVIGEEQLEANVRMGRLYLSDDRARVIAQPRP